MAEFCKTNCEERTYLTYLKNRALKKKTIDKYGVFAITNERKLIRYLCNNFTEYDLYISGLIKDGKFIFSRHRIVIPYYENNKIMYLKARYFYNGGSETNGAKYIGPHNSVGTLSSKRLFNVDVLSEMKKGDKLLITDGEFDTMIAAQCGYKVVGIPSVSNIPENLIEGLKDYDIYLALDNDQFLLFF
jgi:DNA primase